MNKVKHLHVYYENQLVGTLAETPQKKIAFQYDPKWIQTGFSISPFSLPLTNQVFIPTKPYFKGLFGIFADSLPDAWGNLLLDRTLRKHGLHPEEMGMLDRLAIVGNNGMGALTYSPASTFKTTLTDCSLDVLSDACQRILHSEESQYLDSLFHLGGSSGGARPKIMTQRHSEEWIIKFPAHTDSIHIGKMEYDYSVCVKKCGIRMSETALFHSDHHEGYFGTKRFDQIQGKRIHMATVSALLEIDFRQPSLDYSDLLKLTKIITQNNPDDLLQMFRIACFNVFAHNRDDHAKNFSFLYDEKQKRWHLAPAYDMTYSTTYYGEHTTSVAGNGINPSKKELLEIGLKAGLKKSICEAIIHDIQSIVETDLIDYLK